MNVPIKRLIVEERAAGDELTVRLHKLLPDVPVEIVESARNAIAENTRGKDSIILAHHEGAFVKDFPVTTGSPPCGEKYVLTMLNCPFSCTYCYLQSYLEHSRIVVFTNMDKMKREIADSLSTAQPKRVTTGEMGDSLALDHLTGISLVLLPLFTGTDTLFEVRTKSDQIDHLLAYVTDKQPVTGRDRHHPAHATPAGIQGRGSKENLLITWTLGPEEAIRREEPGAVSLDERLRAMKRARDAGIKVAVRFDPIIPFYANLDAYDHLIGRLSGTVDLGGLHHLELGVLRFPPGLWERVHERNPRSPLLHGEYLRDRDGKIRFYRPMRVALYRETVRLIRARCSGVPIELSMENCSVWEDAGLEPPISSRVPLRDHKTGMKTPMTENTMPHDHDAGVRRSK